MSTAVTRREVTLEDRYTAESGTILINGIQALVRLMLEVRRFDDQHGRNTGVFVSGYPGSPLGGLDRELVNARALLEAADPAWKTTPPAKMPTAILEMMKVMMETMDST